MGWYDTNGNDWYKPSSQTGAQDWQPAANLPNGNRKTRVIALIVCLCVFIAGIALIAGGFGSDVIDYNADGKPSDWHVYFDKLYGTDAPTASAEVRVPLADDRGSLTIKNGSDGASLDFSTIYEKCSPSVVGIKVYNDSESEDYYAWGSGVIASEDGYIITNTHVLDDGDSATVVLYDGSEHEAKLIGFDASSDIAVIKIDATGLSAAEFASSSTLSVGDSVAAIGNPLSPDLRLTMTRGIVSALNREINYNGATMTLIQTDASINEGNSGGPLINMYGQVIGITNMKALSTGVEGIGFAIPTASIRPIVNALLSDGRVSGRVSIGITVGAVSSAASEYYDLPEGLYISAVAEGSDAEKKGIQSGDMLLAVNGQAVTTTYDVSAVKDGLKVGDTVTLTIYRDGKTFDVDVRLVDTNDLS